MRVIIAGSREITDYPVLLELIESSEWDITEVVSGGCRGVDYMGESWARDKGIPVKLFAADWAAYGRLAGEIRNQEMARYADALILLWDGKSPGASCMLRESSKEGIQTHIQIYGMDLDKLQQSERAILDYCWKGKGRIIMKGGHWDWEEVSTLAPELHPDIINSLIQKGVLEEQELRVLLPHSERAK